MRLVLDTNVLVAALVARGHCHELLEHVVRRHRLVTSEVLLEELAQVLRSKFRAPAAIVSDTVALLRSRMSIVEPGELVPPVCRDPDDDEVLATAIESSADCLITGDRDLLVLQRFEGIPIVSPSELWAWEDAEERRRSADPGG